MVSENKIDWRPIWWTTFIVGVTNVIIGSALRMIERAIDSRAYSVAIEYFTDRQPDYFPLLYLLVMFIVVFAVVNVVRVLLPVLPSNWVMRGLLIGAFLFLIGDFPNALLTGYLTTIPATAARGMAIAALISQLLNGCILAYCLRRFSSDWKAKE